MPEGLKIIVGADVKQAQTALRELATTAKQTGTTAGQSLGRGLNSSVSSIAKIPAATKPAIQGVSKLGDTIETLRGKLLARKSFLDTEKDVRKIAILNSEIKLLEKEIIRVQAIGAGGVNLGGVGKAATKGFSALRQAAFVLPNIGIAGILGGITEGLVSLFSSADKANDKIKELLISVSSISGEAAASTAGEASKVNALVGVVTNLNKSYAERNRALNELKGINKNYFGDLTLEASSLATLKDRANEYTQAIIQQAVVKKFSDSIADVVVALVKNNEEITKGTRNLFKYQKAVNDAAERVRAFGDGELGLSVEAIDATKDLNKARKELSGAEKNSRDLQVQLGSLKTALQTAVEASLKFRPLEEGAKGAQAAADKTISIAKALAAFLDKNTQFSVTFEVDPLDSEKTSIQKAKEFIERARSFVENAAPVFKFKPLIFTEFSLKFDKNVIKNIREQAEIEAQRTYKEVKSDFEKSIEEAAKRNPIAVRVTAEVNAAIKRTKQREAFDSNQFGFQETPKDAEGKELFSKQELDARKFAGTINGVLTPAFQNLFSAIVAGENPMKAFFESLGQSVLQLIQKLIAAAIQAAILSALFPGGVGSAKGFGAIFGKIAGFASGGIVSGPVLAMVGEGRGTSRNNPEVIAPLDQLRGILADVGGNQQQTVVVMGRIRGNDLALSNSRTSRRNRRLAG